MRRHFARTAVLAALLVVAVATSASATTTGIRIAEPQLVLQRGVLRFALGMELITCNVTLMKTLVTEELIPLRPGLIKLGKITAGRTNLECGALILNLPRMLGGLPRPGPNAESWDLSFLSSNLPGGELNFGILDFQVAIDQLGGACLYRGSLLGTLSTDGRVLRYASTLPLFAGGPECPMNLAVEGIFANEPAITYVLLTPEA